MLFGDAGCDTLKGGWGNDVLNGGAGNDLLKGGRGDDWMVGGTGNDAAYGGKGNDTYHFSAGDGKDFFDGGTGHCWTDTVELCTEGADWTLTINGEQVSVCGHEGTLDIDPSACGVVTFADGSELSFINVESLEWA